MSQQTLLIVLGTIAVVATVTILLMTSLSGNDHHDGTHMMTNGQSMSNDRMHTMSDGQTMTGSQMGSDHMNTDR